MFYAIEFGLSTHLDIRHSRRKIELDKEKFNTYDAPSKSQKRAKSQKHMKSLYSIQ